MDLRIFFIVVLFISPSSTSELIYKIHHAMILTQAR
jgi:hypothetical protein